MKVLLVHPWRRSMYEAAGITVPPMGLLYIAAVLREAGHAVRIQDRVMPGTKLDLRDAELVGITCLAPTFNLALSLADQARARGVPVVLGGPHATFTLEESLGAGRVDYVVMGEGEETILDLVEALEGKGKALSAIPGLAWRNGKGSAFTKNPPRPPIRDLDRLPFPVRELLDFSHYGELTVDHLPATALVTSRGCPYRCRFCVVPNLPQGQWRARSVENVIAEMEHVIARLGIRAFVIVDDNLTLNVDRVRRLCAEILRRGLRVKWWCMSRADTLVRHPDLLDLMARAGCITVFLGLESGNDRTLSAYGKKAAVDTGTRAVRLLAERGIEAHASFILGAPEESRAEVERTIDYALALDPEIVQFSILTPYPGTPLFEELQDRLITRDWDRFDAAHAVYRPDRLAPEDLDRFLVKAYRRFYARPRRLWHHLRAPGTRRRALRALRFLVHSHG